MSRVLKWFAGLVAIAITLACAGFAGLMIMLSSGPIRADGVGARIVEALNARARGEYTFDLGATSIARSKGGPTLVVDRLVVHSGDQVVIAAPHAEISIDPLALLRGNVIPRRIDVSGIDIHLVVLPNGEISIAAGNSDATTISVAPALQPAPASPAGETQRPPRAALLAQAGAGLRKFFDIATNPAGSLGLVERVGVRSGRLIVEDRTADRTTTFDDLNLEFDKARGWTALDIRARGPNGVSSMKALAKGTSAQARTLDIEVKDLSIDEINLASGVRHPAIDSDMTVSGSMHAALEASGVVKQAVGRFALGAGYVRLEDPDHEPFFIDEITGGVHWDPDARRILVDPVQFFAGDTRFALAGSLDPPAKGEDGSWRLALGLVEPGAIAPERPGEKIMPISEAKLAASIRPLAQHIDLTGAKLKGPDIDLSMAGSLDWTQGPHLKFTGQAEQGPVRAFYRIWPSHVAAPVRGWMIGHTHGGVIKKATMSADYDSHALLLMRFGKPPPDPDLTMDFTVSDGAIDSLPGVVPVTGVEGVGHVTGRTMHFVASAASLEVSPGRRLTMTDAVLNMPHNDGRPIVPANLSARVAGPVEAVTDLLAKDSVRSRSPMSLDGTTLHGKVDGHFAADFEIGLEAKNDKIAVDVSATATDFSADKIFGKEKLDNATVSVVSDPSGFKATGAGRIFGGPASFDVRKPANQPATALLNVVLDDAARARAGYAMQGVAGPVSAKISATLGSESTRAQVDLDLTRTNLENGIPGLVKPAGKPAKLDFVLEPKTAGVSLDQLVFEGGGASARGAIELSSDGGFQSARLTQIRLSPGDDLKGEVSKNADGVKIVMRGSNLDARPFLKFVTKPSQAVPGTGGDFDLELKSPLVTGFNKEALSNVDLKMSRKGSVIRHVSLTGSFGREPVTVAMARSGGSVPQVDIATPNAGALLAFTDLYPRMQGGALSALIQLETGRVTGTLKVQRFSLRDEPALRRLVSETPQQNAQGRPVAKIDGTLVQFDRLQIVFTHAGGRLDLRDGLMNGQQLGLTVEGSVDDVRDIMDLRGTYVPAYGINNLFSKIPVVGLVLGGGWNEGLFAVDYHITGRPSEPVLSINPLSAVAPGFLRKLFGAIDGTGAQFPPAGGVRAPVQSAQPER